MKTRAALIWEQTGTWQVQAVELDDPGATEVLVEMFATGLCHSDDHFVTGGVVEFQKVAPVEQGADRPLPCAHLCARGAAMVGRSSPADPPRRPD